MNPDDPTRPIIGQIFKTFVPTKGKQTHHASICWYYRPEQVSLQFVATLISDRPYPRPNVLRTRGVQDRTIL